MSLFRSVSKWNNFVECLLVVRKAERWGLKKFKVQGTGRNPSRWLSAKRSEAKEKGGRRGAGMLGFQAATEEMGCMYRREGCWCERMCQPSQGEGQNGKDYESCILKDVRNLG